MGSFYKMVVAFEAIQFLFSVLKTKNQTDFM